MKIDEINSYNYFLTLEKEWNNVLQKCNHTIFSTWEWLSTWWKHFGKDKKLVLLLAKDDDKVLGIAPLMYSVYRMFGLRMGKIEFIGAPDSDYNDFIIAEKQEECIKLFINHLMNLPEKWDCIDLMDVPEKSQSSTILRKLSKNVKPIHECPYTPLPDSHETFLNSLRRKHRKELRRNLRRISNDFKVDFADLSKNESFLEGMEVLFELHQKRWRQKGFSGVFNNRRTRDFHKDIAKTFSQKGLLGLFVLKLSDTPTAALYGFKYMSKYYAYLSGFDPNYSSYGVGSLLFLNTMNKCIQEGIREFDFMRGGEEYKYRWNTKSRWNYQAIIIRKGIGAKIENWFYKEYWRQANRLKHLLKIKS